MSENPAASIPEVLANRANPGRLKTSSPKGDDRSPGSKHAVIKILGYI